MLRVRLNKELALRLGISRRQADDLIAKGSVMINNIPAILGNRLNPNDNVTVSGQTLPSSRPLQYLAFNKPVGYVCSRREQSSNLTIYSLLPANLHHLKPVGRLDKDSSGLLLLTNDGDFAHHMTHPKFDKPKIYEIKLDRPLERTDLADITQTGVDIGDGKLSKLEISLASHLTSDASAYEIRLLEGRNRQIRRTFGSLGYTVTKLHRTTFGSYSLAKDKLSPGEWKEVTL